MGKVYVIGVGMTKFERPGVRNDPFPVLAKEALERALADAKIPYTEIEQAFTSYIYGKSTCGQRALYEVGMSGIPIINVNNNCASGSTAVLLAKEAVEYGIKDCVLALGFEKMKKGSLVFDYPQMTSPLKRHIKRLYSITGKTNAPLATVLFGSIAIEHMQKYESSIEHFAKIAYKNHKHGSVNPYSQSQKAYTLEEILNSRTIYGPLTKLQCCATTDGAAAAIFASERFVIKHGLQQQAVEVLGMEMATDLPSTLTDNSYMTIGGCELSKLAAYKVYQKTKIHPTDVDVVELHDCFSSHELVLYELLGLCPPGKAAELIDRNDNTYGGKYVVNPSGGLIGKGHPLGATGIAQCAELCWQLRGEAGMRQVKGAKLALQHNYGWGGAVIVGLYSLGFSTQSINEHRFIKASDSSQKLLTKLIQTIIFMKKESIFKNDTGVIGLELKKLSGEVHSWNIKITNTKVVIEENNEKARPNIVFAVLEEDVAKLLKDFKDIENIESNNKSMLKLSQIYFSILQKLSMKCKI
ncbi:hypothetical protein RN001_008116 [Aquatica leii]|uniref:Propanoyl-CoA C-acyltransferase n=1 Tax=Aquatica leii TaxID=1421715 RepID=A0AAN7P3U3_9COLE|nr:hypothetical protein RN001_008116 [Aquatica leii]